MACDVARQGGGSLLPFLLEGVPISKAYLKAKLAATERCRRYSLVFFKVTFDVDDQNQNLNVIVHRLIE